MPLKYFIVNPLIIHFYCHAACSNYSCANGVCVSNSSRCNGLHECGDGSDEAGCGKMGVGCEV